MKTITLNFDKSYTPKNLPDENSGYSGIYFVFAGRPCNRDHLMYIGESNNVFHRLAYHDQKDDWERESKNIIYLIAKVPAQDREWAESACIYHYEPKFNCEYMENLPHSDTKIVITGIIQDEFLVQQ